MNIRKTNDAYVSPKFGVTQLMPSEVLCTSSVELPGATTEDLNDLEDVFGM